jgi:hypothetical protein
VYQGLAVPVGVVVVRKLSERSARPGQPGQPGLRAVLRLLVAGSELGSPLVPAMKRLAMTTGTELVVDLRHGTKVFDWSRNGWLATEMNAFRPTVVLLAMDPKQDPQASRELVSYCKKFGSKVFWLVKNNETGKSFPSLNDLSSWASKIWSVITTQEK